MTQVNTHTDRYAVFAKLPTTEHNTEPPNVMKGFQAVLDNFDQTELNAAYGWTSSDEHAFTASVTEAGGMVHASDFAYNLAVLSQLPPYVAPPPTTIATAVTRPSPRAEAGAHGGICQLGRGQPPAAAK